MDTTRELNGVPAPPPERPLPDHSRRRAELLAVARAAGPSRRSAAAREWVTPFAAATAVLVIVATLAIVVPRVISAHPMGGSHARGGAASASQGHARYYGGAWHRVNTVAFTGRLLAVTVTDSSGHISVTGTSGDTVSVTERISYRSTPPDMRNSKAGDRVVLGYRCADTDGACGVAYDIRVPPGVAVTATTAMGGIRLSALSGRVVAHTSMGTIIGTGLRMTSAKLSTDMGGVDVSFASAPSVLEASSDDGPVTIAVPATGRYSVSAGSELGTVSVTVPRSATSAHHISAHSSLGPVTISTR
jgi:hypothetical protein